SLKSPDLTCDRFFVEKRGLGYQTWSQEFISGDTIEFFYEEEQTWLTGTVHRWSISDGSGNAPGSDAHYFIAVQRNGKTYKLDLYEDLLVRLDVPTDEELIARSSWCEGGDEIDQGPFMAPDYDHCNQRGKRYITSHGQHCWYCDKHI